MVNTTYLVSKALEIGNAVKSSKTSSRQDGDDNFKSMLDKNTQKAEKETQKTDTDTQKTEAKEETAVEQPKEEAAAPEAEESKETLEGEELQTVVQQYIMSNEQKLALNWAEAPVQNVENVQAAGSAEAVQAAGEQQLVGEVKAAQNESQTAIPVQTETAAAQTDTLKQNPAAAQTAAQETQPKQEQKADTAANVEVKAEAKEVQTTVQKGAESQNAGNEQKMELKEQKAAETTDASAVVQKEAPKEENLVRFKVGETINPSEPKAAEKLADTVLLKMSEKTGEYELQLNPQELGKIKIKLVFEDGKINVAIFCENQKAADLLGLTGARLKGIIEERTGSEAYVEVQKDDANPYNEQEKEKNDNGRGYEESKKQDKKNDDVVDFMQQLRLGLLDLN